MAFFASVRANKNALAGGASIVGAGVGLVSLGFMFYEQREVCACLLMMSTTRSLMVVGGTLRACSVRNAGRSVL